jgi:hypothetical protein
MVKGPPHVLMTIRRPGELMVSLGFTNAVVGNEKATKEHKESRTAMIRWSIKREDRNQRRVRDERGSMPLQRVERRSLHIAAFQQ